MALITQVFFGFLAGSLSTLSPCVFPILPIIVGSAFQEHRLGPVALATGLSLGFMTFGIFIARFGSFFGLDPNLLGIIGASILLTLGLILAFPYLENNFSHSLSTLTARAQNSLNGKNFSGLYGQLILGLFLGMVWTPCTGPTLGAAITMASVSGNLLKSILIMLGFGFGAAVPLLFIAYSSRTLVKKLKPKIMNGQSRFKQFFGLILILISLLKIFGLDKQIEVFLLNQSPVWLTNIGTFF